jgi:2-polyprenyl-6-methoxyphenol hydroxylase-like FAD-dependent oxidoreductase
MARVTRALIAGAGLAGLALARRLHALGWHVDVIERWRAPAAHGAGILLTGNALRALEGLGLAGAVLALGRRVSVVRFTDERERELFRVDVGAQPGWPPFVSLRRETLLRLLLDAAQPIVPRFGVTIAELDVQPDSVAVACSDGTRAHYGLVVGADGVHSRLRQQLFGVEAAQPIAGFCGWRFVAPCPLGLADPQYMLGNGRTLLLHPLPEGEVYCGAGPVSEAGLARGSELERLRAAFAGFGGAARAVLDSAREGALIPSRYFHVEQRPWHRDRCVLIGDAAHACAPTLAQGGALSFEDALVLGELLAAEPDVEAALFAFEARRAPRVAMAQSLSLARMLANRPCDPHALAVRNAVFARVGAEQLIAAWGALIDQPA